MKANKIATLLMIAGLTIGCITTSTEASTEDITEPQKESKLQAPKISPQGGVFCTCDVPFVVIMQVVPGDGNESCLMFNIDETIVSVNIGHYIRVFREQLTMVNPDIRA